MLDLNIPTPSQWPMALGRYGLNPYGEPLFRIVFAPSVRMIVGGEFADGFTGYRVRPAYRPIGNKWILEKWISALEHTHCGQEEYERRWRDSTTGLIPTGPYPSRGVYFHCWTFDKAPGEQENIEHVIQAILRGKERDPRENQRALLDTMAREEKEADAQRYDRCKELLPAYGVRAASFRGHVKATKTAPIMKTANELGLPVKTGPAVGGGLLNAV